MLTLPQSLHPCFDRYLDECDDWSNCGLTSRHKVLPGLGMTVVRYNAGGSSFSKDPLSETHMGVGPSMRESRRVNGFWLDGRSDDPASVDSWDWAADPNQVS